MDESWEADVLVEPTPSGRYAAVLVLTPPAEVGAPIRWLVPGEYDHPMQAGCAALDAFAEMTHRN